MKSFLAVLAGLAFTVVVAVVLDLVMHVTGVFGTEISDMTTSDFLLAFSYRVLSAIGAGWITARLAPSRPMYFAVLLGAIGTAIALLGLIFAWMLSPKLGPIWYSFLLVVSAIPCTWFGGKLAGSRSA
ncbi:MAG TPA: hypothetical protein VFO82_11025 [Steroidobacteraceae bacterium]|nr:hypothetical protein [Steroidobacteraceae bacterium]